MAQHTGGALAKQRMAKQRKAHSSAFKSLVALVAHKEDKTISELAGHYGVHPTLIHGRKKHLLAGAEGLFAGSAAVQAASADAEARQTERFEQIGRLKMELEWLRKSRPLRLIPRVN